MVPRVFCRTPRAPRRKRALRRQAASADMSDDVSAMQQPAISLTHLQVTRGQPGSTDAKHVLVDVNLEVGRGEIHALLGPNGCGKSTLLDAVRGKIKPTRGEVHVRVPTDKIAFVPQNPDHNVVMPTAGADVAFALSARGERDEDDGHVMKAVDDALERVRLEGFACAPTGTLSGGQRQRVAVAGTLVVLLLDELTSYLDPEDAEAVLDAVRASCRGPRAAAAIWVTHRLDELLKCDRATYIDDGKVLLSGSGTYVRERILGWQEEVAKSR